MPNLSNATKRPKKLHFIPYQLRRLSKSLSSIPEHSPLDFSLEDLESQSLNTVPIMQNSQNSNQPMTQTQYQSNNTDMFSSLRIPDAIKDLPKFDGNPRLLYEFISNVEEILLFIRETDNTPYGKILLRAIRNKIEGQANEILNMYGTPLNWDDIKSNLILHYSDKRTETSLVRDLHNVKQSNNTVEIFYSQVIEIQSTLCNNILIHEKDANVIKAKKDLFAEMSLNSFLSGLREPLGSRIRSMQPESLAKAFSYCIKEQNISYTQNPPRNYYRQPYNKPFYNDANRPRQSPYPKYTNNNQSYRNQTDNDNRNPFYKNQNPIERNPRTSFTRMSQQKDFSKPNNHRSQQTRRTNNSNFQELNNIQESSYPQNTNDFFDNGPLENTNIEEQNFPYSASKNQRAT